MFNFIGVVFKMVNSLSCSIPQATNLPRLDIGTLNSQNSANAVAIVANPPPSAQSSAIGTIFKAVILIFVLALVYFSQKNKNKGVDESQKFLDKTPPSYLENDVLSAPSKNGSGNSVSQTSNLQKDTSLESTVADSSSSSESNSSSKISKYDMAFEYFKNEKLDEAFAAAKEINVYNTNNQKDAEIIKNRDWLLALIAISYMSNMSEKWETVLRKAKNVIFEIENCETSLPIYERLFMACLDRLGKSNFSSTAIYKIYNIAISVLPNCQKSKREKLRLLLIEKLIEVRLYEDALIEAENLIEMLKDPIGNDATLSTLNDESENSLQIPFQNVLIYQGGPFPKGKVVDRAVMHKVFIKIGDGLSTTENWLKALKAYSHVYFDKSILIPKAKFIISGCQKEEKKARNEALKLFVDCCLYHNNTSRDSKILNICVEISASWKSWIIAECDRKTAFTEIELHKIEESIKDPELFETFAQEFQRLYDQNIIPSITFDPERGFM
jgi:hypothetical protein